MRLVFAGTPAFAAQALEALHASGHDIALVLTQPDRQAGRGMKPQPSAVKAKALELGLRVEQPVTLRDPDAQQLITDVDADVMVVAAYGLILPQAVLDIPRYGCLNIHASLLPRWRGAAPIQRAILAGDGQTGVGIMQMEAGLDTGPVLLEEALAIGQEETAGELHDRLANLGARLIVQALEALEGGHLKPRPQSVEHVSYASKLDKTEARLRWEQPAAELHRAVRAFDPVPGATLPLGGTAAKIWRCRLADGLGRPGTVLKAGPDGIVVACGDGALRLLVLQKPGGRRLTSAEFLAGANLRPGDCLNSPEPSASA